MSGICPAKRVGSTCLVKRKPQSLMLEKPQAEEARFVKIPRRSSNVISAAFVSLVLWLLIRFVRSYYVIIFGQWPHGRSQLQLGRRPPVAISDLYWVILAGDRRRPIFSSLPSTFQMLGNARAPAAHKVQEFIFGENKYTNKIVFGGTCGAAVAALRPLWHGLRWRT